MTNFFVVFFTLIFFFAHPNALALVKGPTLTFKIDEDFLVAHTLRKNRTKLPSHILTFREDLVSLYPKEYEELISRYELSPRLFSAGLNSSKYQNLISAGKSHPAYELLLKETKAHLEEVRNEWIKNLPKTLPFLTSLTRIKFDKELTVFITHPQVYHGYNYADNTIGWGRKADWPNYFTVYLWHETLHSFLQFNSKSHALIELMTDDALRNFLNGGSFPPFSDASHPELLDIKNWIFQNHWPNYLEQKEMSIYQLETILMNDETFPSID